MADGKNSHASPTSGGSCFWLVSNAAFAVLIIVLFIQNTHR